MYDKSNMIPCNNSKLNDKNCWLLFITVQLMLFIMHCKTTRWRYTVLLLSVTDGTPYIYTNPSQDVTMLMIYLAFSGLVGWLCFTSHRQRGHLETAPPFTVPCEGREARFYPSIQVKITFKLFSHTFFCINGKIMVKNT